MTIATATIRSIGGSQTLNGVAGQMVTFTDGTQAFVPGARPTYSSTFASLQPRIESAKTPVATTTAPATTAPATTGPVAPATPALTVQQQQALALGLPETATAAQISTAKNALGLSGAANLDQINAKIAQNTATQTATAERSAAIIAQQQADAAAKQAQAAALAEQQRVAQAE